MAGSTLIENIKNRIDIQAVFTHCFPGRRLVKRGHRWWACCPVHEEKNPSFCLDGSRQRFRCFGCQVHGDGIDLYALGQGLSNREAIRQLAARLSLDPKASPEELQAGRAARQWQRHRSRIEADISPVVEKARLECRELESWMHLFIKHIYSEEDLGRPGPVWALQNLTYIEHLNDLFLQGPAEQLEAVLGLRRWKAWQ
ncbi:MAG: CHC2 zinc finger domain-containing protein [Syntrophomonadaceae bacterium]